MNPTPGSRAIAATATARVGMFAAASVLALVALAGCGTGGDDGPGPEFLTITGAFLCEDTAGDFPRNCDTHPIRDALYETDQTFVRLSGSAFTPQDWECSSWQGMVTCGIYSPYRVTWSNDTNGASGSGSRAIASAAKGTVAWTSDSGAMSPYSPIPLQMGRNIVRVNAQDGLRAASAVVTVSRVADLTPPAVASVLPYAATTATPIDSHVYVFFAEPLDPQSVAVDTLRVRNSVTQQPVAGSASYWAFALAVVFVPSA